MAFPTLLGATSDYAIYTGVARPYISSAGNVYVMLGDAADTSMLEVFKASDPSSSFAATDTLTITSGNIVFYNAFQVGDLLHTVTVDDSNSAIEYHIFDMSTDSWTLENDTITSVTSPATFSLDSAGIVVRSTGDVVVIYGGEGEEISEGFYGRVFYAIKSSGSWTTNVAVDNGGEINWITNTAALGADDRVHFFFSDFDSSLIYQRTLSSSNTLESFPSSFSSNGSVLPFYSVATYDSASVLKVRCAVTPDFVDLSSAKFNSADSPTISLDTDIAGTNDLTSDRYTYTLAANDTELYAVYVSSENIYARSNADDAGWSSEDLLVSSTYLMHASIYTRGTSVVLAVVYYGSDENQYYTEFEIATAPADENVFEIDAAASVSWAGSSDAASNLSAAAAATITFNGRSIAAAVFDADAAATASFVGVEVVASIASGAAAFNATATLAVVGESQSAAAVEINATAMLTFTSDAEAPTAQRFDGWRIKKLRRDQLQAQEEDDLLALATALAAYLELNNVYY